MEYSYTNDVINLFADIISLDDAEVLIKDENTEILFGNFAVMLL